MIVKAFNGWQVFLFSPWLTITIILNDTAFKTISKDVLTHGENKVVKLPLHFPNHFSSCSLRNTLKKSSHKTASPHGPVSLFLDHYWTLQTFCLTCFSYQQQLSSCLHYSCVLLHIFSPTMLYLIVIWLLSEAQCIEKYKTAVSWYIKSDHAWVFG